MLEGLHFKEFTLEGLRFKESTLDSVDQIHPPQVEPRLYTLNLWGVYLVYSVQRRLSSVDPPA